LVWNDEQLITSVSLGRQALSNWQQSNDVTTAHKTQTVFPGSHSNIITEWELPPQG